MSAGTIGLAGRLGTSLREAEKAPLSWRLRNKLRWGYIWGAVSTALAKALTAVTGIPTLTGELRARVVRDGKAVDYGVLGRRVVTDAFVNEMVDELQTYGDWDNFIYHDSGEGNTAENASDTDIETTDGESRASGTSAEGASANIYQSVGTISYTTTKAIVEHGLFNNSTGGQMMDRTVFSTINVANGDQIEFTYELTCSSGS